MDLELIIQEAEAMDLNPCYALVLYQNNGLESKARLSQTLHVEKIKNMGTLYLYHTITQ